MSGDKVFGGTASVAAIGADFRQAAAASVHLQPGILGSLCRVVIQKQTDGASIAVRHSFVGQEVEMPFRARSPLLTIPVGLGGAVAGRLL